jgi:putative component of membrane protein insertase Oxa1/YidC/SpoIIIJ protein YidD
MKFILIGAIKLYRWALRPCLSRTCLFKESCSVHVERITNESGFLAGYKALRFRMENCQPGYHFLVRGDNQILITKREIEIPIKEINPLIHYKSVQEETEP